MLIGEGICQVRRHVSRSTRKGKQYAYVYGRVVLENVKLCEFIGKEVVVKAYPKGVSQDESKSGKEEALEE